jgi:hypothetical protein
MNPKWTIWLGGVLLAAVIAAALYFPALRRQVDKAKELTEKTAEQARRELLPVAPVSTGDPMVKVKMFWGSRGQEGELMPVVVELPLAREPVLRARQVLNTLLAGPVDAESRTLPPDAALLAFYILPDGTGVADFSDEIRTSIPRSQRAAGAPPENFDSRPGSGYAGGPRGPDAVVPRECQGRGGHATG